MNYLDLISLKKVNVYLDSISETQENGLRLIFEINNTKALIQMDFDASYIGYSVLNESYTGFDIYEKFDGESFRLYSQSRYLDFIKRGTFATEEYPGPYKHYGMVCADHIVDIVAISEPIIKEIERHEN